jgi:tetratricopeptide (TPR) repeat protein
MRLRSFRLLPFVCCLGCTVLVSHPREETPETPAAPHVAEKRAVSDDAQLLRDAARRLDSGDNAAALPFLAQYVAAHPEHVTIRAHLAELLLKLDRNEEAREQLERYVADAQMQGEPACRHLAHCHTRLMELAQRRGDSYEEHLHRGIGLYRVAEQLQSQPVGADDPEAQKILFKAIAELTEAAKEQPDEPRPQWYLHEAWASLGQSQPANVSLRRARKLVALGGLTFVEEQQMRNAECGVRN